MARSVSAAWKRFTSLQNSDDTAILLVTMTHDEWDEPIRLTSDNTTKKVITDPDTGKSRIIWVTNSRGEEYTYVLMGGGVLPDDRDGAPARTGLIFDNVDAGMTDVVRSIITPALVTMEVVLKSSPDYIEAVYSGLETVSASVDEIYIAVEVSRQNAWEEAFPGHTQSPDRMPALHP